MASTHTTVSGANRNKTPLSTRSESRKVKAKKYGDPKVDFFSEFADLPIKDSQEQYDEDLQEYTSGEILDRPGEALDDFNAQFRNDFFRYSADFHDRDSRVPGIDQDFGTPIVDLDEPAGHPRAANVDDRIQEEILDLFTRDRGLLADDVSVQVEDGLVTLSGTVIDLRMSQSIEEAIQSVPGVEGVANELRPGV